MNKEILKLSIPNILSNISVPLISTVDTVLMGHLSSLHLGAVGIGAMIFNFIYWNFGFLRMGVTGMTAQEFGRKDSQEQIQILGRALAIAFLIGMVLILFMHPINKLSQIAMNVSGEQVGIVSQYFLIRVIAAPASLMIYVLMGWYLGMQNAIYPLVITILVNLINALISVYLVVYLDWEISGVAWGTVIAQYVGLLASLSLFVFKYSSLLKILKIKVLFVKESMLRFLKVNSDIFLRTVALTFAFAFFYSQSAKAGQTILAVNVILLQLLNWMSYGIDGFAYSAESMVGKYKGASDDNKLNKSIKLAFIWGSVLALIYSIVFYFFYDTLVQFFTNDVSISLEARRFHLWMGLFPIIAFPCYIWDGVFIGLTATVAMRNTMIVSFIAYLGCYFILEPSYPMTAIWISLVVFLFLRGLCQSIIFAKYRLKLQ